MSLPAHKIFVVGNSRSGTTMMGRILGRHPQIFTFNELHFFEQLWSPKLEAERVSREQAAQLFASLLTIQRAGYYTQQPTEVYAQEAEWLVEQVVEPLTPPGIFAYFLQYEAARYDKQLSCDQTPRNVYYLHEILELYPDARIINIIRDPRDVLLSQKNRWRRRFLGADTPLRQSLRVWSTYHPLTTSLIWRSGINAGDQYKSHPRVFQIRFESLLSQPEEKIRAMCSFLQVDFSATMLAVPKVGSSIKTDERRTHGIDSSVAGQWRKGGLTEAEITISQKINAGTMTRHAYSLAETNPNYLELLWHAAILPVKIGLGFVLNVGRAKNPLESLRRRLR